MKKTEILTNPKFWYIFSMVMALISAIAFYKEGEIYAMLFPSALLLILVSFAVGFIIG